MNLFDRPVHSERLQTGGMGLGLFCLSEHIKALQVLIWIMNTLLYTVIDLVVFLWLFYHRNLLYTVLLLCCCWCYVVILLAMIRDNMVPGNDVMVERVQRYGSHFLWLFLKQMQNNLWWVTWEMVLMDRKRRPVKAVNPAVNPAVKEALPTWHWKMMILRCCFLHHKIVEYQWWNRLSNQRNHDLLHWMQCPNIAASAEGEEEMV